MRPGPFVARLRRVVMQRISGGRKRRTTSYAGNQVNRRRDPRKMDCLAVCAHTRSRHQARRGTSKCPVRRGNRSTRGIGPLRLSPVAANRFVRGEDARCTIAGAVLVGRAVREPTGIVAPGRHLHDAVRQMSAPVDPREARGSAWAYLSRNFGQGNRAVNRDRRRQPAGHRAGYSPPEGRMTPTKRGLKRQAVGSTRVSR